MSALRDYQLAMIEEARHAVARGVNPLLIVAPTGAGKTRVLAEKLARFLAKRTNGSALYVVHRRQLVEQTHRVLTALGIPATIVMAGYQTDWSKRVFVVSRDTWTKRKEWINFGDVGLLIFDEAHIAINLQKRMVEALQPEVVLGYTATPVSLSGPGMGALYKGLVLGPTYISLIAQGHLVPTDYVVARPLDDSGLRVSKMTGDYITEDVVNLVKGQILGDIYDAWGEYGGKRTVVFAPSVDVAATIAARFGNMGIRAATLDWSTPPKLRHEILRGFHEGDIKVIVNVDVLSEGWDEPLVDTIILASPTRSLARYLQRVGRGMRPAPGKGNVRIIDLVGSVYMHGAPEDIEGWELEPERPDRKKPSGSTIVKRRGACPLCGREMKDRKCECGFEAGYIPEVKDLEVIPAKLERLGPAARDDLNARRSFYLQVLYFARATGRKDGWAAHVYRERYGEWPEWSWKGLPTIETSPAVMRWIRYRAMRKRKGEEIFRSWMRGW